MTAMAMHQQVGLLLTLILFLAAADGSHAVGTPSAIIGTTCAAVGRPGGEVDYDTCVGLLSADPAAAAAKDAGQLAVVATNLTVANVTSTVLVLDDLVKNLGDCLRYYRDMNNTLDAALGDLRAGRVEAASGKLLDASGVPDDCDIQFFEGSAKKNPIRKENTDADLLSRLAYAITDLQLPNPPRHRR